MSIYISTREKDLGGERGKSKKEVGVRNADGVYRQWYLEIGGGRGTGRSHCSALKSRSPLLALHYYKHRRVGVVKRKEGGWDG